MTKFQIAMANKQLVRVPAGGSLGSREDPLRQSPPRFLWALERVDRFILRRAVLCWHCDGRQTLCHVYACCSLVTHSVPCVSGILAIVVPATIAH